MKSLFLTGLLATISLSLSLTPVLAQESNTPLQSSPFHLQVQSPNPAINGRYLTSCHAGAALNALCVGEITAPTGPFGNNSGTYFWNYTAPEGLGTLTWNLPLRGIDGYVTNISLPLWLDNVAGSNVAAAVFRPGISDLQVGFHNDVMYLPSWVDDSKFVEGQYPEVTGMEELSHWHSCSLLIGSYNYTALAWVTSGNPHNPTCKPVDVVKVNL